MKLNQILTGDCREILPTLESKSFALAFADPPYWVGFDYGETTDKEIAYIEPEFLVKELLRIAECVLITPGNGNQRLYPPEIWQIAWNKPASTGHSKIGGYAIWEPVLVYGAPPKRVWQDSFTAPGDQEFDAKFHKCPKPLSLLNWLIDNFSNPGDAVIDPVCGSGTTCKAAYETGREYLGIEIDPKIAEYTRNRLSNSRPPLLSMGGITHGSSGRLSAVSQQASFITDGNLPSKARGATRRR
jgi:DNA modification methylase